MRFFGNSFGCVVELGSFGNVRAATKTARPTKRASKVHHANWLGGGMVATGGFAGVEVCWVVLLKGFLFGHVGL
jgi:hypothetical protein